MSSSEYTTLLFGSNILRYMHVKATARAQCQHERNLKRNSRMATAGYDRQGQAAYRQYKLRKVVA